MKITSLDLRGARIKSDKGWIFGRQPVNIMDSCQRKIRKVQSTFTVKAIHQLNPPSILHKQRATLGKKRVHTSNRYSNHKRQPTFQDSSPGMDKSQERTDQPVEEWEGREKGLSYSMNLQKSTKQHQKSVPKQKRSGQKGNIDTFLITDQVSLEMVKLRKKREHLMKGANRSLMFLHFRDEQSNHLNSTDRLGDKLYFEREPIVRFSSKKRSEYKSVVRQVFEGQFEREVLASQRSVLMRSIHSITDRKQSAKAVKKWKVGELLQQAKNSELLKVVNRRKSQLNDNLMERRYNPYYAYMNLNRRQKKEFIQKEEVLQTVKGLNRSQPS